MIDLKRAVRTVGLPPDFGDGWLSRPARDLMQLAVVLGGYERDELIRRVIVRGSPRRTTNIRTVENVLDEMLQERRVEENDVES